MVTCSYELSEADIRRIIAKEFDCKQECVYIRSVKERVLGGSTDTIKATVKMNHDKA